MIGKLLELYKKHKEVILYLFFGGLTTVVSIVTFWLFCRPLGMDPLLGNIFSWILAVLFAYFTNARWVFESRPAGLGQRLREMGSFFAGRLATLGVEEALLFVFVKRLGVNEMLVKIIATAAVIVLNYVISKLFVFRKRG